MERFQYQRHQNQSDGYHHQQQHDQPHQSTSTAGATVSEVGDGIYYYPNVDMNVWLRTCQKEVETPIPGHISVGKIPPWLSGCLIRNGPGGVDAYGPGTCRHLFDGPGLLHKYHIENGKVTYSSKFVHGKSFKKNMAAKRLVVSEFGTFATPDPCQTIFSRIAAVFLGPMEATMTDTANISIHPFGDEVYTLAETPFAHRIQLDSLETLETIDVHRELGLIHHTSHPHICGNKAYNIGQRIGLWLGPHYVIAEMECTEPKTKKLAGSVSPGKISPTPSRESGGVRDRKDPNSSSTTGSNSELFNKSGFSTPSPSDNNNTGTANTGKGKSKDQPVSDSRRGTTSSTSEKVKGKQKDTAWSPWSSAKIVATIPSRWPLSMCYMHSFCITQNYFVLIEQPLSIFLPTVPINQLCGEKPIASCLRYYPEEDTLFHVISRGSSGKSRRVFRAPSFFFLHTINGFEMRDVDTNDTFVIVDICCYDDPAMIDCMYVDALKNAHSNPDYAKLFRGRPKRFLLKFSEYEKAPRGTYPRAESEQIVDIGCETPRINYELYDGKPYNYFYAISSDVDADNPGMLIKVDVLKKTYDTWVETNAYPSEPIFVPRPNSQREDDGIVLSTLLYGGEKTQGPNRTSLLILNAQTWDTIAKVDMFCESAIPKCLHGWFFPDADMTNYMNSSNAENLREGYASRRQSSLSLRSGRY